MRPVHPGELLLEDCIEPMGFSVRAVSMALRVAATAAGKVIAKGIQPVTRATPA